MAAGTSVGDLYLRLGLNLSDLETGFVTASQTVAANISRLNRESNLVRIRSEIDIAGLDETADAARILQIRTNALNEQMRIQRDRIRILDAEYQNLVRAQGANSAAARRAEVALERQRLALANLERESRNLNDAQGDTNDALGELNDMLPEMPSKLGAIKMGIGAIAAGAGAAAVAVKEMVDSFREMQKQSYDLNMSFPDTKNFLRQLKLAGGDYGDFEGYIRGITDAYVKGEWDDPEFIALRKYGAEITDATGRLKNFKDITEEVYQAWKKADEAGEGIEFLQLTGGEAGVRDAIQFFKRYEEAKEDAAKIYDAKLDEKQLHELDRLFGRVEEQAGELKNAIGNIFTPAALATGETFFQMLHDGTAILVDNRNEIQTFGRVAIGVFEELAPKINSLFLSGQFSTALKSLREVSKIASNPPEFTETQKAKTDKIMSDMGWRYQEFGEKKPVGVNTDWSSFNEASKGYGILNGIIEDAKKKQKEFNGEVQETTKSWADFRKECEKADKALKDKNPLNQYAAKRIQEFRNELEELQIELDFGDNDYQKEIEKLNLFHKRESVYKNFVSEEEASVIDEVIAARKTLIDLEKEDNLAKIRKSVDAEFKSSIDARIEKINEEKEAWVSAGMDAAEAMELAQRRIDRAMQDAAKDFEKEVDRIKGSVQTLEDEIFEMEHSQYQNDFRKLQQEYMKKAQEFQEEGMLPFMQGKLDYWYNLRKGKLNERAKKDKNYRKPPDGGMQRGGNGIQVISGDQIIDDGLIQAQQKEIALLADENQILAQILQKQRQELSDDAWVRLVNQIQQTPKQQIVPPQQQATQPSGFQIIEGDKVVAMPEIPTQPLQDFGYNLQQLNSEMQQMTFGTPEISPPQMPTPQSPVDLQAALPTESFQALKMSTTELTTAQDILAEKLRSMSAMQITPTMNQGGIASATALINLDIPLSAILQEMQTKQATTLSVETIVLPLNNIASIMQNILSAMSNSKPANINVAPSIRVDLGGAYVFDNAMKKSLTDDITKEIVSEITSAVQSATRQSSYSYGA